MEALTLSLAVLLVLAAAWIIVLHGANRALRLERDGLAQLLSKALEQRAEPKPEPSEKRELTAAEILDRKRQMLKRPTRQSWQQTRARLEDLSDETGRRMERSAEAHKDMVL